MIITLRCDHCLQWCVSEKYICGTSCKHGQWTVCLSICSRNAASLLLLASQNITTGFAGLKYFTLRSTGGSVHSSFSLSNVDCCTGCHTNSTSLCGSWHSGASTWLKLAMNLYVMKLKKRFRPSLTNSGGVFWITSIFTGSDLRPSAMIECPPYGTVAFVEIELQVVAVALSTTLHKVELCSCTVGAAIRVSSIALMVPEIPSSIWSVMCWEITGAHFTTKRRLTTWTDQEVCERFCGKMMAHQALFVEILKSRTDRLWHLESWRPPLLWVYADPDFAISYCGNHGTHPLNRLFCSSSIYHLFSSIRVYNHV